MNNSDLNRNDVGCIARHVLVVDGSQSDVIRNVLKRFRKSKRHALLTAGLERLQTTVEDVLLSKLHGQSGIEIVVHQVVEYF